MDFSPRIGALLLWLSFAFQPGAKELDRPIIYAVYGSDIIERLMRIHRHPERDGPEGTLTAILYGSRPAHIQCRFVEHGGRLICEAHVGAFPRPQGVAPAPDAEAEARLKEAGYWRDANGRAVFSYKITSDSGIWGGASVVILNPLIAIFGARLWSRIDIVAPLAPERDQAAIQRESRRGS
jgi:hypothetical protein